MKIELGDIRPEEAEVEIGDKIYTLRKFGLDDESWLKNEFKDHEHLFTDKMTTDQMCQLVYHQLKTEDKADFKQIDCTIIDDSGVEHKGKIGGWKLLRQKISGVNQKAQIMKALVHTLGISKPLWDKLIDELEGAEDKKDLKDIKKKLKPTGRKSSTGSRTSTATR